jgi:hypothetical protein
LVSYIGAKRIGHNIQIVARKNCEHARHCARFAGIDAANSRMGHRTAENFRVSHSWQTKITGINGLACDLLCAIDATKA